MIKDEFQDDLKRMDAENAAGPQPKPRPYGFRPKPYSEAAVRANSNLLVEELRDKGVRFRSQTSIKCPFHEDTTQSAEIRLQNGVFRFVCHAASCKVCEDFFGVRARFQNKTSDQVMEEYRKEKGGATADSSSDLCKDGLRKSEAASESKSEVI